MASADLRQPTLLLLPLLPVQNPKRLPSTGQSRTVGTIQLAIYSPLLPAAAARHWRRILDPRRNHLLNGAGRRVLTTAAEGDCSSGVGADCRRCSMVRRALKALTREVVRGPSYPAGCSKLTAAGVFRFTNRLTAVIDHAAV